MWRELIKNLDELILFIKKIPAWLVKIPAAFKKFFIWFDNIPASFNKFLIGIKHLSTVISQFPKIISYVYKHPDVLTSLFLTPILTLVGIILIIATHLGLTFKRRKAIIFISYQNERQEVASAVKSRLEEHGMLTRMIPFDLNADHDDLIDRINDDIRSCHVFVCVPGRCRQPSFVENEVLTANALKKPIIYLVDENEYPLLPNTAKHGHPVFSLHKVEIDNFETFAQFCSYLACNWWSTFLVYISISYLLIPLLLVFIVLCPASLAFQLMNLFDADLSNISIKGMLDAQQIAGTAFASQFIILIPCIILFTLRFRERTKIIQATTKCHFFENLPKTLQLHLTRDDLLSVLYRKKIRAEHEVKDALTLST